MRERIPSLLLLVVGSMLLLAPLTVRGQQQPTQLWNTTWGGTDAESGLGVALGRDIYMVGGTCSFGAGGPPLEASDDAFLACYDTDGNRLWNITWGGTGRDCAYGVAVESNVYVVGRTRSFGAGDYDAFLACYDTEANQLWNTTWGGTEDDLGLGVAVGSDVYIVGTTQSFGAGDMGAGYSDTHAFLACYDTDGNQLWNTTWGGTWDDGGSGVAVGSDNVYIVGRETHNGTGGCDYDYDAFLACYDVDGNQLWNTTWGERSSDDGYGVAVGSDIYIVGRTQYTGEVAYANWNAFLVKYGFPPPVAPGRISDIQIRIFEAPENSVYFVPTGNIYDDSAFYAFYAYKENPQIITSPTQSPASSAYLDGDGKPLFTGDIVTFGGRFANRMVAYYEDAGIALVGYGWDGNNHLFTRISDGSSLYAVDGSTYNADEKDYFVFQIYRDGDRYILSEWGICAEGTYAGGMCFIDTIIPNIQDFTNQYYIYSWTDLNNDDMPQQNEISQLTSG